MILRKRDHDNGRVAFKEADQDGDNFLTLSEAVMKRFNRKKEDMDALKDSPYDSDTFDYTVSIIRQNKLGCYCSFLIFNCFLNSPMLKVSF